MIPWKWALILGGAFAWGWVSNGWRLNLEAEKLTHESAQSIAAANQKAREAERQAQEKAIQVVADERKKLEVSQNETNRLRDCIRRGTCGVRIVASACPATVPKASEGGPVGSGESSPAPADVASDYLALRSAIEVTEAKLSACQSILRGLVKAPQND